MNAESTWAINSQPPLIGRMGEGAVVTEKAQQLFRSANWRATIRKAWAFLTRRSLRLQTLDAAGAAGAVAASHSLGTRTVTIDKIRGTLSRQNDFDDQFNPIHEEDRSRWVGVALAWLRGETLPAVDLIEVEGTYFVRDGHHRVSVARALGQAYIDAEITQLCFRQRVF